ncbi:short-chain dehydrogenase reductase SDR [Trametopsis cervina]|nr:short-chain dehydrogenase reductase SDR [Trametopsis cervina]
MASSTKPKTVFITGCSSGIGLAAVQLFHSEGWNVVATMRKPAECPAELLKINPQERLLITRLDVQDIPSIEGAVKEALEKFGKVDVLVNNAGFAQQGLFEALTREQIQAQFDVNVFGVMDVTRALLPHFRAQGGGGIIMISSEGFTEALSYECGSQNIFVKSVVPHGGVMQTDFMRRAMTGIPQAEQLSDYAQFQTKIWASFSKMGAAMSITSTDVAKTVLEAATDGTDRLRYWTGNDTRGFVKARYESKDDEEYMRYMRSFFI